MTRTEFLDKMKSYGAIFATPASQNQIRNTNMLMQRYQSAMLPMYMIDMYSIVGGIKLGSGYIFGPNENEYPDATYPVPSITKVNEELSSLHFLRGKTIFGRNDLFLFLFDTSGTCYMTDNLTLKPLRKYEDPFRAMQDCLMAGKIS